MSPLIREPVGAEFIAPLLAPYKTGCCYLLDASVEYNDTVTAQGSSDAAPSSGSSIITGRGRFAIEESCYINDTGHLNSVELNICYNQLAYVVLGAAVEHRLIDTMHDYDSQFYRTHHLPAVLIVEMASRFRKPINPRRFEGTVTIERAEAKRRCHLLHTSATFFDDDDGFGSAQVLLAAMRPETLE